MHNQTIRRRLVRGVAAFLLVYFAAAYLAAPALLKHYARRHPHLQDSPRLTTTGAGVPGDPLNVCVVGTEDELKRAMLAAGWFPADPLGLKSDVKIAAATVLGHSYADAPVSNLYLFGRREDLAFECPVGKNPRQRHHVRFWRMPEPSPAADTGPLHILPPGGAGAPTRIGSATFDRSVGLSHRTGQITHHIDADVDAERDFLFQSLDKTGALAETYGQPEFQTDLAGKNGGGDPWRTDGALEVGLLAEKP